MKVECPECGAEIVLEQEPIVNEIIECSECGVQLVVKQIEPNLILEVLEDVGEDWGE